MISSVANFIDYYQICLIINNTLTMCLPVPLLKFFVGIGAVVSAVLALGVLALTIVANLEKSEIIDNADKQIINDFLVAMYIISIFFLLLAICGIYGVFKTKKNSSSKAGNCLLSVYSIGVMIFLAIFLGCTIVFFAAPPSIFGDDCKSGSKTELIPEMYELNEEANAGFCTQNCPCYFNESNVGSDLYNYLKNKNRTVSDYQNGSYIRYQDCISNQSKEGQIVLFAAMQQFLNCGGWCDKVDDSPNFLKFTDINDCVTQECYTTRPGCYIQFRDFMIHKGKMLGAGAIIATLICALNILMICCLCCHPKKRDKKVKNFYARMMD